MSSISSSSFTSSSFSDLRQVYSNISSQMSDPTLLNMNFGNSLQIVNNDLVNYDYQRSSLDEIKRHINLYNLNSEKRKLLILTSTVKYSFGSESVYEAEKNLLSTLEQESELLKARIYSMINIMKINNPEFCFEGLMEVPDELPKSQREVSRRSSFVRSSFKDSCDRNEVNDKKDRKKRVSAKPVQFDWSFGSKINANGNGNAKEQDRMTNERESFVIQQPSQSYNNHFLQFQRISRDNFTGTQFNPYCAD